MNLLSHFLILILSLASISVAEAHAFLDHADPKVGSTVAPPTQVKVYLTEELEGAFSKLQVFDAGGSEVDKKDVKVSGSTMTVSVSKLGAGTYKVIWKALSTDTHKTSGTFTFSVH